MDAREVLEGAWESRNEFEIVLQNAVDPALLVLFDDVPDVRAVVPPAIPAPAQDAVVEEGPPAQPAAILEPEAHVAGGDPSSPGFAISIREALDSDIVLAVPVRISDLVRISDEEDYGYSSDEEDYGYSSDEEVEDEDHGEDKYWDSILFDQKSKSTVLQLQPPSEHYTVFQVYRVARIPHEEDSTEEELSIIHEARMFLHQIREEDDVSDSDLEQFDDDDPEIMEEFFQMQLAVDLRDDNHPQELSAAQDQVECRQELVPLDQALVLQQPGLEEDQPGAVDVSPAAPSITALELPQDDVPAEAAHVDVLRSPTNLQTDIMLEADDASSKLREEVARPSSTGAHVANPALAIIPAIPVIAVRSENAADLEGASTSVVSSLDPIHDQEGSITPTALPKKELATSSESNSFTAGSSLI